MSQERPEVRAKVWTWMEGQDGTPGIGIVCRGIVMGHLTPSEAHKFASQLKKMANKVDTTQE